MARKISPAIFGIALICFLLPWVNVSCQGQRVASFSGFQLVTGTTIEEPVMFGPKKERKIKSEPFAILALLATIAGLGVGFLKGKTGSSGTAVIGGVGIIMLLLLKSKLDNEIFKQGQGLLQLDYMAGFYLTLLLFLLAIGVNIYSAMQSKRLSLLPIERRGTATNFCSQCGAKVELGTAFCSECGHSLK